MARPRKYINRKLVKELAQAQLTNAEIARICKVSPDTIERRYAVAIKEWRRIGVGSVRRELFTTAMGTSKGKVTAAIFFLKNYGGMSDVVKNETPGLGLGNLPIANEFRDKSRSSDKPN